MEKLDLFYKEIIDECIKIIVKKQVKFEDLAFNIGMSVKDLYNAFQTKNKDLSIYLDAYDVLTQWQVN